MSNGLQVLCAGVCVFSFSAAFFILRSYAVEQGLNPRRSLEVLWPALRDKSHPMKATAVVFILSFVGSFITGVIIALNNPQPIQPPHP